MALVQKGLFGLVTGKVGNLVYYVSKGENYVRSRPRPSSQQPTSKQTDHRDKFRLATRFISPLAVLINTSYQTINKLKTGTNVLMQQLMKTALIKQGAEWTIDYFKVSLLTGRLPLSACRMNYHTHEHSLELQWDVLQVDGYMDDEINLLVYDPADGIWNFSYGGIPRLLGEGIFDISPTQSGKTLHIWAFFCSIDRRQYSSSTYLGKVITKKLPADENPY